MALTEKRKADREQMAAAVIALAQELGATAAIDAEWSEHSPRAVMVRIEAARGLCLCIDFDGESCQPDVHVMSWHMSSDVDTCLSQAFARVGGLNNYHFRKATTVAYGFENLLIALRAGLELAASGEAFSAEREAAAIAKAGETAADRNARFDAWRVGMASLQPATSA